MPKLVHLYKRRPAMEVEEFHAALAEVAASDPPISGLTSYVQSHTLLSGYRKGELLFDAIEEFSFDTLAAVAAFTADPNGIHRDRTDLVDPDSELAMIVDVYRVKDRPIPHSAVKNIEFVNRSPRLDLDGFRRYWREIHGPLGSQIPSILRYEQNHLALASYKLDALPRYDGLAITWFSSTATMREGALSEAYREVREDELNFLAGHLPIIITKEVLFR